jgi:hypothetical protein
MPRLTVDRIRKRFGQIDALRDATFRSKTDSMTEFSDFTVTPAMK